jgi:hypothetical protein
MGLLDDAIREHLELKRLRGVDPHEVAREESAALDPVRGAHDAEPEEHSAEPGEHLGYPEGAEEEIPLEDGHASDAEDPEDSRENHHASGADDPEDLWDSDLDADDPPKLESGHAIQETAEIDMRTVLEAEDLAEDASASTLDREPSATDAAPARSHRSLLRRRRRRGGESDPLS